MSTPESLSKKSSSSKWAAIVIVVVLVFSMVFLALMQNPNALTEIGFLGFSQTYTYDELVDYALVLINNDRTEFGLENVTVSEVNSAQLHADNMLQKGFFSHWDVDGLKPYMRYTLAGGVGSVSENCAALYSSGWFDAKEALKELEWQMMYNDSESDWGHKNNILTGFHNRVSIGIAYDDNSLYFVQDFENSYIDWDILTTSENEVHMKGTVSNQDLSIEHVAIFYDNPRNLTTEQLDNPPYSGSYDQGTYVGLALPKGWVATEGITVTSMVWSQTGNDFEIKFDFSEVTTAHGEGVYTLYIRTDQENNELTSYSIWR
ncbi:MAG: hypothetical protein CW691_03630 [Candidatus Bathyarchaeum sp.]|nr:MAG: hypothetical protein CW691_03630 [Candidatus Bathyarchaeum sp.]